MSLQWSFGYVDILIQIIEESEHVQQNLIFDQTIQLDFQGVKSTIHNLNFVQTISPAKFLVNSRSFDFIHNLFFTQSLGHDQLGEGSTFYINRSITQLFLFDQSFEYTTSLNVRSDLVFESLIDLDHQRQVQIYNRHLEQSLFFIDNIVVIPPTKNLIFHFNNELNFTDQIEGNYTKLIDIIHKLDIFQAIDINRDINISVIDTFNFYEDYYPLANLWLPIIVYSFQEYGHFTLSSLDDVELILPDPEYNNRLALIHRQNLRRAMSGDYYSYINTSMTRRLEFEFNINPVKMDEIREFILSYGSQPLIIKNWKNEVWYGYLLMSELSLNEKTFSFSYEGVRMQ